MILTRVTPGNHKRVVDLQDMFHGQTAMLVGAAPSLREQPIELLSQRGVLTMAMNNAATHFRPVMWVSGDHPECYDPQILHDPGIMKFGPMSHAGARIKRIGRSTSGNAVMPYCLIPNIHFYMQEANVPWDEYLGQRAAVPWYNNTLLVGIHILYMLGIRRIILAGSDFGFAAKDVDKDAPDMYAHKTKFGDLERKWNLDLYNSLVKELRLLKPIFKNAGLTLMDSSKNSRISQVYEHISLETAVDICLNTFPIEMVDPSTLPHCSKFAPESIQKRIAQWPGHRVLGLPDDDQSEAKPKGQMERLL